MVNEKICYLKNLNREYCTTVSELFNNAGFYIWLEKFSNIKSKEDPQINNFLNVYFNDEGYVDIWRIPRLLMDLATGKCQTHSALLYDPIFRTRLLEFLGGFYNYAIKKTELFLLQKNCSIQYDMNLFELRKNQCIFNLITETYCTVIEKIRSYGGV